MLLGAMVPTGARVIPLTQGMVAWVDEEDYERVCRFKWCAERHHRRAYLGPTFYAKATVLVDGVSGYMRMHRFILNAPCGVEVDHVDPTRSLDNRRENLRLATHAQNMANGRKRAGTSSQYKGVCFATSKGRWQAGVFVDGKTIFLGRFDTEKDAANAYNKAALAHWGQFARLNQIEEEDHYDLLQTL